MLSLHPCLQESGRCFETGRQFMRNTKLLMAKMAMKDWTPTATASACEFVKGPQNICDWEILRPFSNAAPLR